MTHLDLSIKNNFKTYSFWSVLSIILSQLKILGFI